MGCASGAWGGQGARGEGAACGGEQQVGEMLPPLFGYRDIEMGCYLIVQHLRDRGWRLNTGVEGLLCTAMEQLVCTASRAAGMLEGAAIGGKQGLGMASGWVAAC